MAAAGTNFYTYDLSGNTAQALKADQTVNGSFWFDCYGGLGNNGPYVNAAPFLNYGGQWGYYSDIETGLELLSHRFYDISTGRFLTRDPAGYGGGVNLYSYVQNNPVNDIDPLGFCDDGKDGWNTAADFFGGFGHTASFGLTDLINGLTGAGSVVNTHSLAYGGGSVAGLAVMGIASAGTSEAAETDEVLTEVEEIPSIEPSNLKEQLYLEKARSGDPNELEIMQGKEFGDPRLAGSNWAKMQLNIKNGTDEETVVHWFRELKTGRDIGFKFKKLDGLVIIP